MKFKAKVYRDAIKELNSQKFACYSIDKIDRSKLYSSRFTLFFRGEYCTWLFSDVEDNIFTHEVEYKANTELGRRTREIALELAAHLEETGEIDKILKGE